jgi:hypothetical protein
MPLKAIIDMAINKNASIGIEPHLSALQTHTLPTEPLQTLPEQFLSWGLWSNSEEHRK